MKKGHSNLVKAASVGS